MTLAKRRWIAFGCALLALLLPVASRAQNTINTIVGGGSPLGNGNPLAASVDSATAVVLASNLINVYVSSLDGEYVFKIDTDANTITVLAGTGFSGFSGVGGPATNATLSAPAGLALDGGGANLFIADLLNQHIYEVNLTSGTLTNFAGSASPASPLGGFGGDGGPATQALLNAPTGVAVFGSIVYIADSANNRIRVVASNGTISTFAGNGTACANPTSACGDGAQATLANLNSPSGVAVDSAGNVYVADTLDNRIRCILAVSGGCLGQLSSVPVGSIVTVAGTGTPCVPSLGCGDNGIPTGAELNHPFGVFVDSSVSPPNIYIADELSQEIREVTTIDSLIIQTVAGDGSFGFAGDGGSPTSASLDDPTGVFVDINGNILIADQGSNRIRQVAANAITTIAGGGTGGDGGAALNSVFGYAYDLALDSSNNQFVIDKDTGRIREVAAGTQIVTTVVGSGTSGYSGDGQGPTTATLDYPRGVAVVALSNPGFLDGAILIADSDNNVVRDVRDGQIVTYAGNGTACSPSTALCGDGGLAISANLTFPNAVAVDANGNLFIADTGDNRIRVVDPVARNISTAAGTGTACPSSTSACGDGAAATLANLSGPTGLAINTAGDIFIADSGDNRIRCILAVSGGCLGQAPSVAVGSIVTVAFNGQASFSGDGGLALLASMTAPNKMVVDSAGNLFISGGLDEVVRRVDFATKTVATVAGNTAQPLAFGFSGDGGPATSATLANRGVAINPTGGLYIADNNRIRFVQLSAASVPAPTSLDFGNQTVGIASTPLPVTLTNSGGNDLLITSIVDANGFSQTNNCPLTPAPLAPAQFCTINVIFTPTGTGTANDTLTITDNAAGSPQKVPLAGVGLPGTPIAVLAPPSLTFGKQSLGTTSAAQVVTLTNTGTAALTITSVGFTGADASDFKQTNNCGNSLVAGSNCTITVTFSPVTPGVASPSGSLSVADNASSSPQTSAVTGTTQTFSLTTTCTSLSVVPGQTAIFTVDMAPVNGFTQSVALACTGVPAKATCTVSPSSIALDGATTVTAKVTAKTTPATSSFLQSPFGRSDGNRMAGLAGLAGIAGLAALVVLPGKRRTRHARRVCGLIFFLCMLSTMATMSSCGGGGTDPPGTTAGTYPLTVTGTFQSGTGAKFTESVSFNLVVK